MFQPRQPTCDLCGAQPAPNRCPACGRRACGECLRADAGVCAACLAGPRWSQTPGRPAASYLGWLLPFILLMLGLALTFLGFALTAASPPAAPAQPAPPTAPQPEPRAETSVGAVLIIGPIPIVFGSGPDVSALLPLAIALTAITFLIFLFAQRALWRRPL